MVVLASFHLVKHQTTSPSNVQPERDPDHLPFIGVKLTSDEDDEEAAETIGTGSTLARAF